MRVSECAACARTCAGPGRVSRRIAGGVIWQTRFLVGSLRERLMARWTLRGLGSQENSGSLGGGAAGLPARPPPRAGRLRVQLDRPARPRWLTERLLESWRGGEPLAPARQWGTRPGQRALAPDAEGVARAHGTPKCLFSPEVAAGPAVAGHCGRRADGHRAGAPRTRSGGSWGSQDEGARHVHGSLSELGGGMSPRVGKQASRRVRRPVHAARWSHGMRPPRPQRTRRAGASLAVRTVGRAGQRVQMRTGPLRAQGPRCPPKRDGVCLGASVCVCVCVCARVRVCVKIEAGHLLRMPRSLTHTVIRPWAVA